MNRNHQGNKRRIFFDTNLQIIFGITLLAVMGVASITPAFPKIIQALGISSTGIGLLITVFTFPGIFLTPILGVFADRYGRKRILIPSMFLFGIAGGACAFSRDFNLLEYRGAFMSLNGMVLRLGQTLGPLLMGIIFGLWGVGATFYAGAALSGLMFLFGVIMIR
jgi:predicted MFS family arabinose efflux permease